MIYQIKNFQTILIIILNIIIILKIQRGFMKICTFIYQKEKITLNHKITQNIFIKVETIKKILERKFENFEIDKFSYLCYKLSDIEEDITYLSEKD